MWLCAAVVQHGDQGGRVYQLGSQARPHHIVGVSHHLHTVPGEVGVRHIGPEEHGLTWGQLQMVQEEDDEASNIPRILIMEPQKQLGHRIAFVF